MAKPTKQQIVAAQQQAEQKLKKIQMLLNNKVYSAESNDITVNCQINENNQINEFSDRPYQLKGALENLDPATQKIVESALDQFIMSFNEAVGNRTADGKKMISNVLKQSA
jgi:hypothetical protein